MNAAKLAQMNAMHMDRKSYEEPSPQMGSLPPPPTTLAHQRFLKQMQRQYAEHAGKPDILRDSDEPLDLGKERQRSASLGDEPERPDRPDRSDRSDRSDRPDRPDRPDERDAGAQQDYREPYEEPPGLPGAPARDDGDELAS